MFFRERAVRAFDDSAPSGEGHFSRRGFLVMAGLGGAAAVATVATPLRANAAVAPTSLWSDPATWGGRTPGESDVATITTRVVLDADAVVAGVVIEPGGALVFRRRSNLTLESRGNVVVKGRLAMRPRRGVTHRLVFTGIDESRYVGGGMEVLDTDIGLWVMDSGNLRISGPARLPWTRSAGPIGPDDRTLTLQDEPTGWQPGDELIITPTQTPQKEGHFDRVTVASVEGRTVTLNEPVGHAHPHVAVGGGVVLGAEVLNLTRNVSIEGTPGGRAHVLIHATRRQTLRHLAVRYAGPRQIDPEDKRFTAFVLGRYGLHLHHAGHASHGSVVEGVVVRDCGSHAFVTHNSHGVTLRGCISHDTFEDAYWYDTNEGPDELTYDSCVASLVRCDPEFRGYRLSGFLFGMGNGNVARNCVAVGVQGNVQASGFIWPESSEGVWDFTDCVAHNNRVHGIFTWQNTGTEHLVDRFVGYNNGGSGIFHGAYRNPYIYSRCILYGNRESAVELHATSSYDGLRFTELLCDGAGLSDYAVNIVQHNLPPLAPTLFASCTFKGYTKSALGFTQSEPDTSFAEQVDVVDCSFEGNEFWMHSGIHPESFVRVQDARLGAISLERSDRPGSLVTSWNARVNQIGSFATSPARAGRKFRR